MKPTDPDNEDELFAEAVKDVTPLGPQNLAERTPPRRPGTSASHPEKGPAKLVPDGLDDMSFVRNGIQTSVLRKLRNGQIRMEEELDLHGHTVIEAERALRNFLFRAQAPDRQRGVRIIHGKGLGSPEGKPVLKKNVREWLYQNESVLASCQAKSADGGSGAVHVLLRRR